MRLPEKSEIRKLSLLEQQEEVKIGLRLARQIDDVRLELIKEQNNLNNFRNQTAPMIQKEIDLLFAQKKSLETENEILEHHNQNLKNPFDEEWEKIRKMTVAELDRKMEIVEDYESFVKTETEKIYRIRSDKDKELENAKHISQQVSEEREQATRERMSADKILENSKIQAAVAQSRIAAENNQLDKKKEELALTLRDIQVREAAIEKSVRELARRERFINSKYKVMMQTQNALQQK